LRLSVSLSPLQQTHEAMSKLVYRLWLGGVVLVTPFSAWHGWHIECTLTHTTGTRSAAVWRQWPVVILSLGYWVFEVRCSHHSMAGAVCQGVVVGLSGGTVPRTACRIQLVVPLISSGWSFETLLTL